MTCTSAGSTITVNDRNAFSASFNFLRWKSPNGIQTGLSSTTGAGITGNGDDTVTVRNGKATWTSTFPPAASSTRSVMASIPTARPTASTRPSSASGLGYLDVSVAGVQLGPATYLPRVEPMETRHEFADDLSWAKGKHTIKFGFSLEHVQ